MMPSNALVREPSLAACSSSGRTTRLTTSTPTCGANSVVTSSRCDVRCAQGVVEHEKQIGGTGANQVPGRVRQERLVHPSGPRLTASQHVVQVAQRLNLCE